ncbi:hypothetical protein CCH79_00017049, partial [Gambusia affinis]
MSGPSFTPPAEVAEINRIHYELEYTEGISQRMRIPETLKVAQESGLGHALLQPPLPVHTTLMQVPERIVVAGVDGESRFVQPRDLDLIQSASYNTRSRRERSAKDANINLYTAAGFLSYVQSTTRRAYQQVLELLDDSHRRTHLDLALDMNPDESGLVDASSLRRQIVKLNRRLQLLEEENKERSKREVVLYSATVAFWLINTWIWFRR